MAHDHEVGLSQAIPLNDHNVLSSVKAMSFWEQPSVLVMTTCVDICRWGMTEEGAS
jgi:hypothetical protein